MANANGQAIGQNEEDQQVGHDPSDPSVPIKVSKKKIEGLDVARVHNICSIVLVLLLHVISSNYS